MPFAEWESFYVIVGSSAGALTGLQFVVIALVADSNMTKSTREIDAFATPTIVHFCTALLVSAILSAPWHSTSTAGLLLAVCGVAGVVYAGIIVNRTRKADYSAVLEDWIWHLVLPFAAYGVLAVAGIGLRSAAVWSLFGVAATSLLLLFIGIHNAWDTVTYVALARKPSDGEPVR